MYDSNPNDGYIPTPKHLETHFKIADQNGFELEIYPNVMLQRGMDYHAEGKIDKPEDAVHAAQLLDQAGIITLIDTFEVAYE